MCKICSFIRTPIFWSAGIDHWVWGMDSYKIQEECGLGAHLETYAQQQMSLALNPLGNTHGWHSADSLDNTPFGESLQDHSFPAEVGNCKHHGNCYFGNDNAGNLFYQVCGNCGFTQFRRTDPAGAHTNAGEVRINGHNNKRWEIGGRPIKYKVGEWAHMQTTLTQGDCEILSLKDQLKPLLAESVRQVE